MRFFGVPVALDDGVLHGTSPPGLKYAMYSK